MLLGPFPKLCSGGARCIILPERVTAVRLSHDGLYFICSSVWINKRMSTWIPGPKVSWQNCEEMMNDHDDDNLDACQWFWCFGWWLYISLFIVCGSHEAHRNNIIRAQITANNNRTPSVYEVFVKRSEAYVHECVCKWVNVASIVKHFELSLDWKSAIKMQDQTRTNLKKWIVKNNFYNGEREICSKDHIQCASSLSLNASSPLNLDHYSLFVCLFFYFSYLFVYSFLYSAIQLKLSNLCDLV